MGKKKKQLSLKKRFSNIWSHLRHPGFIFTLSFACGLVIVVVELASPCGKGDWPVDGRCETGEVIGFTFAPFLIGLLTSLFIFLLVSSREQNDGQGGGLHFLREIRGDIARHPKWWKRWFPVAFLFAYIPIALINFTINIGTGLPWYYTAGQYLLSVSFISLIFTAWILKKGRQFYRRKKKKV